MLEGSQDQQKHGVDEVELSGAKRLQDDRSTWGNLIVITINHSRQLPVLSKEQGRSYSLYYCIANSPSGQSEVLKALEMERRLRMYLLPSFCH